MIINLFMFNKTLVLYSGSLATGYVSSIPSTSQAPVARVADLVDPFSGIYHWYIQNKNLLLYQATVATC